MENEETLYSDFMEAFGDDADYHTDDDGKETVDENTTDTEDTWQDDEGDDGSDDLDNGGDGDGDETPNQEENPAKEQAPAGELFTLKVNKEERQVSRDEVISLAQKGADYDRVKEQLTQSKAALQEAQASAAGNQAAYDALKELAEASGVDMPTMIDNLKRSLLKSQGLSDDAITERLARQKLETENAALKKAQEESKPAQESAQERAQRELADFRKKYPDVELTKELVQSLTPDVQSGMSFTEAYQKHQQTAAEQEIARLKQELEAEKQNKSNRARSLGSQKDSGGRKQKSEFEEFENALFG